MAPARKLGHICQARRNKEKKEEEMRLLEWAREHKGRIPKTISVATQTGTPQMAVAQTETRKATIKIEHLPKCLRARVRGKREEREREQKKLEKQRRMEREKRQAEEAKQRKIEKDRKEAKRLAEEKKVREAEKRRRERRGPKMRATPNPNPPNLRALLDASSD
jgi:transposase